MGNGTSVRLYYGLRIKAPAPERGAIQRWNTPGYRHCQEADQQGNIRTWLSKDPSWEWIETTNWKTPTAKEQR